MIQTRRVHYCLWGRFGRHLAPCLCRSARPRRQHAVDCPRYWPHLGRRR